MLAAAALLTALVWADPRHPQNLDPIDTWWHDLVVPAGDAVRALARTLDVLGGDAVSWTVRLAVGVWLALRRRWRDLAAWVAASILADVVVGLLKDQVGRLRPDASDTRSYPSGHAKYAAQIAIGLALIAVPRSGHPRRIWAAAGAWIAAMAWSRTALDVHHLSDVIAGALIGGGFAFLAWGVADLSLAAAGVDGAHSSSWSRASRASRSAVSMRGPEAAAGEPGDAASPPL